MGKLVCERKENPWRSGIVGAILMGLGGIILKRAIKAQFVLEVNRGGNIVFMLLAAIIISLGLWIFAGTWRKLEIYENGMILHQTFMKTVVKAGEIQEGLQLPKTKILELRLKSGKKIHIAQNEYRAEVEFFLLRHGIPILN